MFDAISKNGIHVHLITSTVVLAMAVLFLLPALDNGFPFVFPDTGTYLGGAGLAHIPQSRPIYYAWFTRAFDLRLSPWPSVVVQSLITAWMIWRFAWALFGLTAASRL